VSDKRKNNTSYDYDAANNVLMDYLIKNGPK
jgi:hypothetical protein